VLPGHYQQLADAARNRRINVGLHLDGFQCQKFSTKLHRMVHLHGDATDETRGGRADLPRIFGIRLGVAALDDSQGYFFPGSKTENLVLMFEQGHGVANRHAKIRAAKAAHNGKGHTNHLAIAD